MALAVLLMGVGGREAAAANLIRDAEIENTIRAYATPLFEAAGLTAQDVRIYIINDDQLNAFVSGGMNLFINTGLLMKTKNSGELIGVIAHETGHIAGGHLARFANQRRHRLQRSHPLDRARGSHRPGHRPRRRRRGGRPGRPGLRPGRPRVVQPHRGGLGRFRRACRFLDRSHQSAKGFASFMETLENQEFLTASNQSPYVRTHPITRNRVRQIEAHLKESPYTNVPLNPKFEEMHRRMVAKLVGFLKPVQTVLREYPDSDSSVSARYARAIAYYRISALDKALPLIDGLIRQEPKNPYFEELKGQMLFENGRIGEALPPYQTSVRLAPDEALLRIGLAHTEIESGGSDHIKDAIKNLLFATNAEPDNVFGWDLLAVAYGRDGQLGLSALSQAEASMVRGQKKDALFHLGRAEKLLPKSSPAWVRLQDLKHEASREGQGQGIAAGRYSASGCREGWAASNAVSAMHASNTRITVG